MAGEARQRRQPSRARGRWRLVLARREAVPASLRRLVAAARRHRSRVLLPLLTAGLVLVLVVTGLLVVYQTSLFAVRDVTVEGTHVLAADPVRRTAAIRSGTPLAGVDLSAAARRVRALPAVRAVEVRRDWPHTVVVAVTERTAVAGVPHGGSVRIVDRTGVVFRTVPTVPAGLPVLTVSHPGRTDEATRAGLSVLAALTPKLRDRLVRVEVPRPTRIRLILHKGLTVVWGDSTGGARKAAAATALLGKPATTIDVSAPDLVVVR